MKYTKTIGGAWARGSEIKDGTEVKIVSETVHSESRYKDEKTGAAKFQDVCKARFEGKDEALNVNLNRATIYGLIDAFGEESKEWIGKPLTAHTEKVMVGGKRQTALYLIPEGFEVRETADGYVEIAKKGGTTDNGGLDSVVDADFDEPTI